MSFFNSEIVRAEMAEISELQEEIYGSVFKFPTMTRDDKIYHVNLLDKLLNKQQVLYTRLSLSDDPEAIEMKERITQSAIMMGMPPGTNMNIILNNMSKMLDMMRQQIDKTDSGKQNNEVPKAKSNQSEVYKCLLKILKSNPNWVLSLPNW